jgi:phospholipid-binding lipoprotein MlaA
MRSDTPRRLIGIACALALWLALPALARAESGPTAAPENKAPAAETPAESAPAPSELTPLDDATLDALDAEQVSSYPDPLEPGNRLVLHFNDAVDRFVIGPISDVYGFLMPDPAEHAVRRMFRNLSEPISFANHALQFHPHPAGQTLVRFCVNSTVGLAGAFDVAEKIGLPEQRTDFGGTLYRYGAPSGPYLVVPVFGPTTVRDTLGDVIDSSVTPTRFFLSSTILLVLQTGNGITERHEYAEALDALRDSAVDYYAALRSAYYFNRESELRGGAPGASDILRSSADTSASNPSRSSTEVYSDLRSASSDTVPFK